MAMERGLQRRVGAWWVCRAGEIAELARLVWGWVLRTGRSCRFMDLRYGRGWTGCGVIERAVGEEGFAGGFFEEDLVGAEELVDFVALFEGDEEDFAFAGAPGVRGDRAG